MDAATKSALTDVSQQLMTLGVLVERLLMCDGTQPAKLALMREIVAFQDAQHLLDARLQSA